jgi:hypothetical protein
MKGQIAIDVFIYALKEQMKKMTDKQSDTYLTIAACKELAEGIKKETELKTQDNEQ